ncbi:uncharacterized protein METZ01_LOCUS445116 [marine metagenome]|uniref:Uncharacterized protein n=1 Tax=marine metagenome TaxID=408172 RepID=A0A382Z9V1_9ZZZZ
MSIIIIQDNSVSAVTQPVTQCTVTVYGNYDKSGCIRVSSDRTIVDTVVVRVDDKRISARC